jgi:hypothetical protein
MVDGGLHLHPLPLYSDDEIIALNAPDPPDGERVTED